MDNLREMGKFTNVTTSLAVKEGVARGDVIDSHVVIGTPGTVMDLLKRRQINPANVKVFVLDEADNMLDQQGLGDQSIRVRKYHSYTPHSNNLVA
jgi:ATP-dependent RNA helicase DDX19/DBP5